MPSFDTSLILTAAGVVTPDVLARAAAIGANVAQSRTGKLIAIGVDQARMVEALSSASGIPVCTSEMLGWATQVMMLPSTARQLRDLVACPLRRDPSGTLHIAIADPETFVALDKLLIDFKVYLASEPKVRGLLANLYSVDASGQAQPMDAIEIDMEASRRNLKSPPEAIEIDLEASQRMAKAPVQPIASTSAAVVQPPMTQLPTDPFAARSSGSMKRPGMSRDDETMRIQRAPRGPAPAAPAPAATTSNAPSAANASSAANAASAPTAPSTPMAGARPGGDA